MHGEPQEQHRWLEQLLGEWTVISQDPTGNASSDQDWVEKVRSLSGLWVVCEGQGTMPDGKAAETLMTLGFNPETGRYVGTWVGSMMTHMWVYDGELEDDGRTLALNCDGPDFESPGRTARYQDRITFVDANHRTLTARVQNEDGSWNEMMRADYRRR